jgi:hypothetical protein
LSPVDGLSGICRIPNWDQLRCRWKVGNR